jgi:ATP-dependent Clp protease ATP-binding subunit ClpA
LEVSLHMAFVEARQQRHEFITVEHLLLALLDNPSAAEVLRACAANIDDLRKSLTNLHQGEHAHGRRHRRVDTQPTLGFQRVIQRAIMHVQSSGKKEVTGANVLVAIFGEKDSHAVYYLHQQGVTRLDVVNFISHGISRGAASRSRAGEPEVEPEPKASRKSRANAGSPLEQLHQNLNAAGAAGQDRPADRPRHEVERVIQILCRRRKNNPLLVGEAGVGKTAIAEGLAWRIVEGRARDPGRGQRLLARHGRAAGRHQVPRRLRAAPEGRAQAAQGQPQRHPVHRRDPHPDRRRRGLRRHAGRVQPAQAGAVVRRS